MKNSEDNIRRLLEMLDNPDAYSEQEILDIAGCDEDTRMTYRLMVEARRSSRHRRQQQPVDVDAAWRRFPIPHTSFRKIAASFIGLLLVSGIAAAVHVVWQSHRPEAVQKVGTTAMANASSPALRASLPEDSAAVQPVIYNNIPLEKMLTEIAAHYDVEVTFANAEVRGLRFRFVWNPQQGIDQVVSDLNRFERLTVTRKDSQITVE